MITAKQAKEKVNEGNSTSIQETMRLAELAVNNAIKKSEMYCNVNPPYLTKAAVTIVITRLQDLGYKVEYHSAVSQLESNYFSISWG